MIKYVNDIATLGKTVWEGGVENADTFADVFKHFDGFLDGIGARPKAVWRNHDDAAKLLEETLETGERMQKDI